MQQFNINYLEKLIKEASGIQDDPIKIAIKNALQSSCTIGVKNKEDHWSGSGFHIGNGYIATVAHVAPKYLIGKPHEVHVTFDGKQKHKATIIVSNPDSDTALLFCHDARQKPAVELGDSDKIQKGDIIAVIASPEGWHDTTSVGRVTTLHQSLGNSAPDPSWNDMMFIDAETLEGASGGMVIATDGKAYGMVQGVVGENAKVSIGEKVVCPINKLKQLLKMFEPK